VTPAEAFSIGNNENGSTGGAAIELDPELCPHGEHTTLTRQCSIGKKKKNPNFLA